MTLGISPLDGLAFAFYVASWIGYTCFADHSRWHERSIMKLMDDYRVLWMQQMLRRENRIVDTNIIGNLQNGAAFFASTRSPRSISSRKLVLFSRM